MNLFRRKAAKESTAALFEAEHARLAKESGTVEFSGRNPDASSKPGKAAHDGFACGPCPSGKLTVTQKPKTICPGFKPPCGTIELFYNIPSGTQSHVHPNPGQPFAGVQRMSYLPDNVEGRKLLSRYQLCWLRGESLEIGHSVKLKRDNQVKWRDQVPHKTSLKSGGAFGWPDPSFLDKANQALDSLGIPNSEECLELLPHSKLFNKKLVESEAAAIEAGDGNSCSIGISSAQTLLSDLKVLKPSSAHSSPSTVVNNGPDPSTVISIAPMDSSSKSHIRHFSDPQVAFAGQQHQHPTKRTTDATHRRTQSVQQAQNAVLGCSSLQYQHQASDLCSGMVPTFKDQCGMHPHERRTARLQPSTGSPLHTPMVPTGSTTLVTETVEEASAVPMATSVVHVHDAPAIGGGIILVKFQRKDGDTLEAAQSLPSKGGSDTLEATRVRCDHAAGVSPFHATPEEAAAIEKKEKYFEVTFGGEGDTPSIVGQWNVWQDFTVGDVAELVYPGGASNKNVTIQVELRDRNP